MQSEGDPLYSRVPGRGTADQILRRLTEAIATGQLLAGERLPTEDQLSSRFQVAPMTLRQALAQLRELEYVETRRGRKGGTFVRLDIADRLAAAAENYPVSIPELRELSDWRRAISGEACALAANRATEAERFDILELAESYRRVASSKVERRFSDARMHIRIAEASGSPRIAEAEREIQEQLTRMISIMPELSEANQAIGTGHDELIAALIAGHADAARSFMIEHIEATYNWGASRPLSRAGDAPAGSGLLTRPSSSSRGSGGPASA